MHSLRRPRQPSRPAPRLPGNAPAQPGASAASKQTRDAARALPSSPPPAPPLPALPHSPLTCLLRPGAAAAMARAEGPRHSLGGVTARAPQRGGGGGEGGVPVPESWGGGKAAWKPEERPPRAAQATDRLPRPPAAASARGRVPLFVAGGEGGEGLAGKPARRRGRRRVRGATGACPAQPPHESVLGRRHPAAGALLSPTRPLPPHPPPPSRFSANAPRQAPPAAGSVCAQWRQIPDSSFKTPRLRSGCSRTARAILGALH